MSEQYLEKLIKKVSKLPGLGPRSSRRVVLHLLKDKKKLLFTYNHISIYILFL